jgi:chaperonin GroES
MFWSHLQVLHSGKVIAVGAGARARDGTVIPPDVKEGDIVLLPEYGGSHIKLEDKE